MANKISDSPIKQLCDIAITEEFNGLKPEIQSKIIEELSSNGASKEDGGIMGKLFGNKKENASMHIAFTLCCILLLLCGIDIVRALMAGETAYTELVKNIVPIITLALGYIFGKGDK